VMLQTMPVVHFLPFEIRHVVPKQLVPKKKVEEQKQDEAGAKDAAGKDPKSESAEKQVQKKASPSKRKAKEGPPAPPVPETFVGEDDTDLNNPARFLCPIYKTSSRAGALSTTGQSTNYILSAATPIDPKVGADHWTLRGAAILTMHDA